MLLILLVSCDLKDDPCRPSALTEASPADGAELVHLDAEVSLTLDGPADDAEVFIDGGATSGAWWPLVDGQLDHTIAPDALLPDQQYTATVRTCGQEAGSVSFTTLPAPLGEAVVGRTYALDLLADDLTWIEPPRVPAPEVLEYALAKTTSLLFMPTAAGGTLELLGSFGEFEGDSYRQHDCVSPATLSDIDFSADPWFRSAPADILLSDRGADFTLSDVVVEGVFSEGGDAMLELRVSMLLDVRQLESNDDLDFCGILGDIYDVTCVPCADQAPDAEEPSCAMLEVIAPRSEAIDLRLTTDIEPGEGC